MTKVYGQSDDNIYFEGDVYGQVSKYNTDEAPRGVLVYFSDGTILEVKYGKLGRGIWGIMIHKQGDLFDRIEPCFDEDADIYSDIAYFRDGLKSAIAATEWENVS